MPQRKRQRGATVVEMAIVATIGMTLLASASPGISQFAANRQMRSAADSLRSGLRIAQVEALNRQRPVELVLTDDAPRSADVSPRPEGRNWIVRAVHADGSLELIAQFSGLDRTPRVLVHAERSVFAFDAFGRLRDDPAGDARMHEADGWRIALADRDSVARPLRVVVTSGGSSTACDPAAAPEDSFACG